MCSGSIQGQSLASVPVASSNPLVMPPWLRRSHGGTLAQLPTEILNVIASYVEDNDLFSLRATSNRGIRNGVDHVWVARFFTNRYCTTTETSIVQLEAIGRSRFARHIHSIDLRIHVDSQQSETQQTFMHILEDTPGPSSFEIVYPTSLCSRLTTIFRHTTSLDTLHIRAPTARLGFVHDRLRLPSVERDPELDAWNEPGRHIYYGSDHHQASRKVLISIIMAIKNSKRRLDVLAILDFTGTRWQSIIPMTTLMLRTLANEACVQCLSRLDLDLELFTDTSNEAILSIVELIEGNVHLKHFKLLAGFDLRRRFTSPSENWAPLLTLLGIDPPFRLHALEIDGLITCSSITLDRIVATHANTLRRIVLNHVNFRLPSTLRAFFATLAETDLEFLALCNVWVHDKCWLTGSTIMFEHRFDEVLDWYEDGRSDADETYMDWVDISWTEGSYDNWITYDNVDGTRGKGWMQESMLDVVEKIDCGSIDAD